MTKHNPAAIIGMGCFFPKSSGIRQFWRLIFDGLDAVAEVPPTHWSAEDYYDENPDAPDRVYCKRGGFLPNVSFDPTEFGIPPSNLEATDTSQLLGLLAAKSALEHAGYREGREFDRSRISVILGATGTQELVIPLGARLGHPKWRKALKECGVPDDKADEVVRKISESYVPWQENSFPGLLGNVIAGRICNRLDLGGTNCAVDAACASSMSALHLALMELSSGKSDMVVTGGVDALNDIFMHMCFSKTHILSPTGDARPFSKDADGTVLGEGIGIIVLKRLEEAERDGDKIYAVIKGIGTSSDGRSRSIYSPGIEGQTKALAEAYRQAEVDPSTVELIEAHGTGTRVGDRVEFQSLSRIFANAPRNKCALGSIKSNIGHTKAAAGSAGLIKAALSLYNKVLPPTLKVDAPDPELKIEESPFYLNTQARPWIKNEDHPRRAGVSAFGFGGSNFHVVMEEYDAVKESPSWTGAVEIFALSSSVKAEIGNQLEQLKIFSLSSPSFEEISVRAAISRESFKSGDSFRLLFVFDPERELSGMLSEIEENFRRGEEFGIWSNGSAFFGGPGQEGKLAFVFPGQGSQYVNMGREIVCMFPEALKTLQKAEKIFKKLSGGDSLADLVYPKLQGASARLDALEKSLRSTEMAQPAIGLASHCMANVLKGFGVSPDAVCGHSFGELTALCAAGRISEDDFHRLAFWRGRIMAEASGTGGSMCAVKAPLDELENLLNRTDAKVVLANRNSPEQGVFSGPEKELAKVEALCGENGFVFKRLPVSAAFHSPAMQSVLKPFVKILSEVDFRKSIIPVYSNATGGAYPENPAEAAELVADQIVSPVDFSNEIENMYEQGARIFLEVGPKTAMTGLVRTILKDRSVRIFAMDGSSGKAKGCADLAKTLCFLAACGRPVRLALWEKTHGTEIRKQRMSVPISGANIRFPNRVSTTELSKPDAFTTEKEVALQEASAIRTPEPRKSERKIPERNPAVDKLKTAPKNNPVNSASEKYGVVSGHQNHSRRTIMKDKNTISTDRIQGALSVVRDGLKSIQSLQMQTAETHKKFLETQSEANRTLQQMMEQARRLAEAAAGVSPRTEQFVEEETSMFIEQPSAEQYALPFGKIPTDHPEHAAHSPKPPEDRSRTRKTESIESEEKILDSAEYSHPLADNSENVPKDLEKKLLSVVSDLTGYPEEMLGLDMDIESDLGIDSIKRVEILSTLEEKMPGLPSVSPERMGKMKTLGQVLESLSSAENGQPGNAGEKPEVVAPGESPGANDTRGILLEVVSELTGYPVEMLGLEMDIESDLGIDSIKRVEILSALEERTPGLPPVSPEKMGKLKTLGEIFDYLAGGMTASSKKQFVSEDITKCYFDIPKVSHEENLGDTMPVPLHVVSFSDAPAPEEKKPEILSGGLVVITGDDGGLPEILVEKLVEKNIVARFVPIGSFLEGDGDFGASGLVIVSNRNVDDNFLSNAFLAAKAFSKNRRAFENGDGSFFATVSFLDGKFGFDGKRMENPEQGGLAGLVKTASIEWPDVRCRALDLDPRMEDPYAMASLIVDELSSGFADDHIEIGLGEDFRVAPSLISTAVCEGALELGSEDVVVVSGGARGVTARAVLALAKETSSKFVLLGRSPLPGPEPSWLEGAFDEKAMKQAIVENAFESEKPSPADVERIYRRHAAAREILDNLGKIGKQGSMVRYIQADVCDAEAVCRIFDGVRSEFGPIRAVVHGAGVLEDRLIEDKTVEQFRKVYDAKVKGLKNLLKAAAVDGLKHLVLFSSVAGRFGNKGQADYAMANEAMNKIARREALARPHCRVVSINWGPWDGGMVSPALRKEFERRNIPLIALEAGGRCMVDLMRGGPEAPVEVIAGAPISESGTKTESETENSETSRSPKSVQTSKTNLSLTFKRELDLERHPVLEAHRLDGKPVVPLALMTEWLGCGALHENPGLTLQGLDKLHVLNGIKLDEKKTIRLLAGKARKSNGAFEVDVEIRDGFQDGREVVHSRAKAILADGLLKAPEFDKSVYLKEGGYSKSVEELYDRVLFHGVELQGIKKILNCTPEFMTAIVSPAPAPEKWMADPIRSRWLGDPLVLDSAFQMAIVWTFEQKNMVCLPSFSESYRQYRRSFPSGDVTAVLEIKEVDDRKFRGDFTFLDENEAVVARLTGYEALMDPSLLKSFKPEVFRDALN